MKLQKITPTDRYKEIEFGLLKDNWCGKRVLTPTGFEEVKAFDYIKTGPSIHIRIDDNHTLICDPGHILMTNLGPNFAKNLTGRETLVGYNGKPVKFEISKGDSEEFYDIEISDPHWYYTESVLSHNTLMMCNNAFTALKHGHNVMFVTFELSSLKTAMRIASAMTKTDSKEFVVSNLDEMSKSDITKLREKQASVKRKIQNTRKGGDLVIYEMPPDECSTDSVRSIIDTNYKLKGWRPKVVVLDYLELMMSRRMAMNDDDYTRQKSVATEVRALAKNEEVFVISATQTNRSGLDERGGRNDDGGFNLPNINLNKSAESFGKTMPVDYVISLNQTTEEYNREPAAIIRLWIAKNRNGQKFISISTNVFYKWMTIEDIR